MNCAAQPERTFSRASHDFRCPDTSNLPDESLSPPSVRSDEPRQTQYALGNIQLHARDAAANYPYNAGDMIPEPSGIQGILPGRAHWGWSSNESTLQGVGSGVTPPVGLNPLINNNIAMPNAFETDMSDQTGGTSRHNSTGFTPRSTNSLYQTSSNTSYSPTAIQEDDPLTSAAAVSTAAQTSISAAMEESFKVPPGWETGGTGMTPGFSGMTPNSAEWDKMMQSMNWEGTVMTPN